MEIKSEFEKPERLYDIDWLRVLGILAVFLFHCSHYFDFEDWHVKNPTPDIFITVVADIIIIWVLPLIFIISGISARISLSFQKAGKFIKGKMFRLLIPLVFGIIFLTPHQVYIERFTHGQFSGSFFGFLPHYFDGLYGINGNFGWMGLHLWYLEILFFYSLILLPLFLLFRKGALVKPISRFFSKPGMIFIIFIPLALFEVFIHPDGLGMREFAGWGILTYLLVFIYGYVIFSSSDVRKAAEKLRFLALILALGCFGVRVYTDVKELITPFGTIYYAIFFMIRTFCMLNFIIAIIGFANRSLQVNNGYLSYSNEAVLPFYILHQPIIVAIGFFIINWGIHPIPKWLFLIVSSFITIMIIYHFVIRRNNPLRFLFGMKLRR